MAEVIKRKVFTALIFFLLITAFLSAFAYFDLIHRIKSENFQPTPQYTLPSPSYSTYGSGHLCTFSCLWTNETTAPMFVYYSTNVTGTWTYKNSVMLTLSSGSNYWANFTATLPSTIGTVVGYYWVAYANGQWNVVMPTQTLTVLPPYSVSYVASIAGTNCWSGSQWLFDGCIVFLFVPASSSYEVVEAYNLTTQTLSTVWSNPSQVGLDDIGVANNTLYLGVSAGVSTMWYTPDVSTMWYTYNLVNWYKLGNVALTFESVCQYTGSGTYNGVIYFGGTVAGGSEGAIDAWYNGADTNMWTGTGGESDDCWTLVMYNSTCMIGEDTAVALIYTNNGLNFGYEPCPISTQYPFAEGKCIYLIGNIAYMAAEAGYLGPQYGGIQIFNGTLPSYPVSWNPCSVYSITNTFCGCTMGPSGNGSWTSPPGICTYNPSGTEQYVIWENSSAVGAVFWISYFGNGVWYAQDWDQSSNTVTILEVTSLR